MREDCTAKEFNFKNSGEYEIQNKILVYDDWADTIHNINDKGINTGY